VAQLLLALLLPAPAPRPVPRPPAVLLHLAPLVVRLPPRLNRASRAGPTFSLVVARCSVATKKTTHFVIFRFLMIAQQVVGGGRRDALDGCMSRLGC
jgi:hypothetical protein